MFSKCESDPESEPEPSSEPEPISVLPDKIENPVFGICQNTNCIICPVKTDGKVGEFYAFFLARDTSKVPWKIKHWHSKNNLVLLLLKIYKYVCVYSFLEINNYVLL